MTEHDVASRPSTAGASGVGLVTRLAVLGVPALGALLPPGWLADLACYPLLGIVPGLVLAERLTPGASRLAHVALGLAAGPLAASLAGWALVALGVAPAAAAWSVGAGAAVVWLLGALAPRTVSSPADDVPAPPRLVAALAVGLALAVLAPPLLNRYVAVRGDTWTHAGIVMEILERGIPPEDPRFAGIHLHYVWFYNFFVALLCSLRGGGPFTFMAGLNVATAFATVVLVALAALRLARRSEAASGAAALIVFGLNAGAYLLWPLGLLRAFTGDVRGADEVARYATSVPWGDATIITSLAAPFALMVSFLDKLLVGSPLAYAYLLMIMHLWAVVGWLGGGRTRDLAWVVLGAAGMMLFHGVVALSVIPVWIGTLGVVLVLRARWPWLPSAGRLAAAAVATLAGALVTTPYMLAAASGWEAETSGLRHSYVAPNAMMVWTMITACGVVLAFAWRPWLAAWRERRPLAAIVAAYLAATIVFACTIQLPENNEAKFVFQALVPAALLAGPSFASWLARRVRGGPARWVALALLFVVPAALTLHGFVSDPGRIDHPTVAPAAGARALDAWIRERTPRSAVVVDASYRDLVMVGGRRPLYLGTSFGPERAAFPLAMVVERRRVVADLYGPAPDVMGDAAALERLGRPVYVVFRPEDDHETARAWAALAVRRDRFEPVYDREGHRVLRLIPARATP